VRLTTHNALVRFAVRCVHDVRTSRKKRKLVRLVSVHRFEVPVRVNIHCDDYIISLTSRSLYVKRAYSILDL